MDGVIDGAIDGGIRWRVGIGWMDWLDEGQIYVGIG